MLSKLFGSRARVKILKLFLLHPEEKFYIRQLSRYLGLQINSVRRELENLEKFGLLVSVTNENTDRENNKKNNKEIGSPEKKYYKVNTNFVLYDEIKALIVKAQVLYEKDFVEKLKKTGKIKLLILTGIFTNYPQSPIDILVVGKFNKTKFLRIIKELENDMGRELNYTLLDYREYKYRRDITDVFLYNILEGKKIIVIDET